MYKSQVIQKSITLIPLSLFSSSKLSNKSVKGYNLEGTLDMDGYKWNKRAIKILLV